MNSFEDSILNDPLVYDIWHAKYRNGDESSPAETRERVARALCVNDQSAYAEMSDYIKKGLLVPAGRINAGIGTEKHVTLLNCYVSDTIDDSMAGIQLSIAQAALTMQQGGGIGSDFSTIRPRGAIVGRTGSVSSGVLPFADQQDAMCKTVVSAGTRRGAMMLTLRDDHPDLWNPNQFETHIDYYGETVLKNPSFISVKRQRGRLTQFNISVLVSNAFMKAVENDEDWDLGFHVPRADGQHIAVYDKPLPYNRHDVNNDFTRGPIARSKGMAAPWYVYNRVKARVIWEDIMRSTYTYAEPGIIFIDRINELNNLNYAEDIRCTNPCFTGDTQVWTDEGPRAFKDLAATGRTINVLTELDDGTLAYRPMIKPRLTQKNASLLKLTFSAKRDRRGGRTSITSLRCTPSHEFFIGNSRIRADALQPGMSLESAYRFSANSKNYMRLRSTSGDYVLEHHLAAEATYGRRPKWPKEHGHHLGQRSDNRIGRIEILPASQHNSQHMQGDLNPSRRFGPQCNPQPGNTNGRWRDDISTEDIRALRESGLTLGAIATQLKCSLSMVKDRLGPNHTFISSEPSEKEDVYCGTVPSTGRFFVWVGEGEGLLVSNCGEQPLPPHGTCCLGSVNLAFLVQNPFSENAVFDWELFSKVTRMGVRMLDNVLDLTRYPLAEQHAESMTKRRIGLGITGYADALIQLGYTYGSRSCIDFTASLASAFKHNSYRSSIYLAKERGPAPAFDFAKFGKNAGGEKVPLDLRPAMAQYGMRNGVVNTIAPNGTISMYSGNVASGHEPVFSFDKTKRRVRQPDGSAKEYESINYSYRLWEHLYGVTPRDKLPSYFVSALEITPERHLAVHAVWQEYIDASISKTINCPTDMPFSEFKDIYLDAYQMGCKGVTTYRYDPAAGRGFVMSDAPGHTDLMVDPATLDKVEGPPPSLRERPAVVEGRTYKLRWALTNTNWYVNVTRTEEGPLEMFITTQDVQSSEWVTAFSRLVTAVLRRGGNFAFLVHQLKEVHSPRGGLFIDGQYCPSIVAAIGRILEKEIAGPDEPEVKVSVNTTTQMKAAAIMPACPACHQHAIIHEAGCKKCIACGHEECG